MPYNTPISLEEALQEMRSKKHKEEIFMAKDKRLSIIFALSLSFLTCLISLLPAYSKDIGEAAISCSEQEYPWIEYFLQRHLQSAAEPTDSAQDFVLAPTLKIFPVSIAYDLHINHAIHSYLNYLVAIDEIHIPETSPKRGEIIEVEGLLFHVLHPTGYGDECSQNNPSIVLRLQYGDLSLLRPKSRAEESVIETETTIEPEAEIDAEEEKTEEKGVDINKRININTSSLGELQEITGVGPAIAQRIITYRETHGPFQRIEEIMQVSGIGEGRFKDMEKEITVDE